MIGIALLPFDKKQGKYYYYNGKDNKIIKEPSANTNYQSGENDGLMARANKTIWHSFKSKRISFVLYSDISFLLIFSTELQNHANEDSKPLL